MNPPVRRILQISPSSPPPPPAAAVSITMKRGNRILLPNVQRRSLLPTMASRLVALLLLLRHVVVGSTRTSVAFVPSPSQFHSNNVVVWNNIGHRTTAKTTTTTRSSSYSKNTWTCWAAVNKKSNMSYSNNNNNNKNKNTKQSDKINNNDDDDDDDNAAKGQLFSRRRQMIELSVGTIGLGGSFLASRENTDTDYGLWGLLPIGTYKSKPTICNTIVPHTLWTCDQKFGILNVQVPLRMTIVKLQLPSVSTTTTKNNMNDIPKRMRIPERQRYSNDDQYCLLIYNPIAPTRQCVQMIQQIEAQEQCHVRHIVVGSVALEHKVYAASMGQQFRYSTLWLTPGQYTFPFAVPEVPYLGFPTGGRTKMIPHHTHPRPTTTANTVVDWPGDWDTKEIQSDILGPIISRDGAFSETVLYHRPTRTLIVTDTCVQITDEVPQIYQTDRKPLLYHARDTITDMVTETPDTLRKGWKRIVLFSLYFMPSAIVIKDLSTAIHERRPDINADFLGIYPWDWVGDEKASWEALTGKGKPLVAPILQVLLLNRSPVEVLDFANRVATHWDIQRIIPSHFKNNLALTGNDYRNAFQFLTANGVPKGYPKPLDTDLQLLRDAEVTLIASGAIVQAPPKVGTKNVSRSDILAQTTYRCRSNVCAPKAEP